MKLKLLALVIGLQAAWILAATFYLESQLATGEVIQLETTPIDPRDLLRGDYINLNYTISTLPREQFESLSDNDLRSGQPVWVLLEKRGEFHMVVASSTAPLKPRRGQVMLKGTINTWWGNNERLIVRVFYGLERFYVREGTGNPVGKITAEVSVPKSGRGMLKEIFIDGKPYAEAMKATAR